MYPGSSRYVLFTQPVLEHMYSYAQRRIWQTEAGGEIFCPTPESSSLIINSVAGPNPKDRRSRYSWNPDNKAADEDRLRHFLKGQHAVGLWHTHPECSPNPSGQDRETTRDYLEAFQGDRSSYLMVIIGNQGNPPSMAVWVATLGRHGDWLKLEESVIPLI